MNEMGRYCKAYLVKDFRSYDGWKENLANLLPHVVEEGGEETEVQREELKDDDILYLQENYVVTDGIFKEQNIIFDDITDEWKKFCEEKLGFEIPSFETIEIAPQVANDAEQAHNTGEPPA